MCGISTNNNSSFEICTSSNNLMLKKTDSITDVYVIFVRGHELDRQTQSQTGIYCCANKFKTILTDRFTIFFSIVTNNK